ncbi:hypothetical protein B0H14DRAFT_3141963 [Mycena olivaceomarginata]|nr:hypothetical protein B0H14DRAFT_3141963 [Mycena olivaceomarginata]
MCLSADSQRACVLATSLPSIPASRFTLRSLALALSFLVYPAPVLYPVRRSRWSSSLSDPLLQINSLNSVLGCATGQCMLNYSHVIVEFTSQPGRRLLAIARREHMERAGVKHLALAPMDMARDWLFSMRKIGPVLDDVTRWALWSYQLGLQTGFMPIDLHDSVGLSSRMVSGRLRGQWLALRRHLSFPSLRKLTLRAEDDDGFAPMAEIRAVLDRNARTLRHLVLGAYLARHHSWDAVFQSSVIRTLTHLDLVDTRISGLVLGRVAHARALVSLTLHGTFEDVKGATVIFAGDHVLDEGEGGGRQHTLLPHLHSFRFLLLGHDDQHPLYAAVAAFLAHRPLLRRLDLGRCPWELCGGAGALGCAAAGGARTALTTVVAERDLSTLAALQAGAQSQRGFRSTLFLPPYSLSAPPPPLLTLSFLSRVLFCLSLPGSARELEASAASSNEHAPALRAFPALAFLHLQNTATHRPKPNLVSEREFAQQTEGWVAAARGVARVLPGLDFLGWHGKHYVVVRRTGERRHLDGQRENGEEGEADEEVELKELPCRRHLDCGKGGNVGGEDATWLERKDVPIDYEMPVVS